jgi:hypothetical protein
LFSPTLPRILWWSATQRDSCDHGFRSDVRASLNVAYL